MPDLSKDDRIFVQIAAYRDPELLPTLRDCIAQADAPERLTFGICWQHDADDSLQEFADRPGVRILSVHYSQSRGACWARSETQALYQGEGYTLQIDSHHRFIRGWDTSLRALLRGARERGSRKPLITSYAPAYEPGKPVEHTARTLRLVFDGFTEGGPFQVMPVAMQGHLNSASLEPARFLSAHFLFTLGCFCLEVPYDPKFYFFGEEPAMALRAFTHGYDLFHPRCLVVWHHYGREQAQRHWTDNKRWWLRNERSLLRYRRLVGGDAAADTLGEFGLGRARTLEAYERYAGLNLADRRVSPRTLRGAPPLHPWLARWTGKTLYREYSADLALKGLPADLGRHPDDSVCLTAHCPRGRVLQQRDLKGESLLAALAQGSYRMRLHAGEAPASWSLQTRCASGEVATGKTQRWPGG
jgi:hypothetical protein